MNATLHPGTFKAAVAVGPSRTEIQAFDQTAITSSTGLLCVAITGVYGSDGPYSRTLPQSRGPLILGRETAGHIEEAGELAKARSGLKEGDYAALEEYVRRGHREYRLSNEFRLCDRTAYAPLFLGRFQSLLVSAVEHRTSLGAVQRRTKMRSIAVPPGNGIEWAYLR
ncbi:alcohol dehydrogenase-like protein [Paraburkholderia sp. BL18I3N2]|uniref:alcohol dehydrogenase catalytic domain-containing protein n=1 Tax=Paraburkholderia sp. BL18I3N2 TaxID=1938799 RepID=UPI000D4221E8|nr:alcohol dehydrogenase catalytic domain-containing protein [Paraburkholderia sp. BL18I3N2]PRX23092.1 alcohol dehydrogenase-like protein [Paraburkholderia sp. BL18I3N2]